MMKSRARIEREIEQGTFLADVKCRQCGRVGIPVRSFNPRKPFCPNCIKNLKTFEFKCLSDLCGKKFKTWDFSQRYCKEVCRKTHARRSKWL